MNRNIVLTHLAQRHTTRHLACLMTLFVHLACWTTVAQSDTVAPNAPTSFGLVALGPGPNAPNWNDKTVYPEELFYTPLPVHYANANGAGFKGWQGFDGAWGATYNPTRVTYPIVSTPLGTKPVLQVTFPGSSTNIDALNETTAGWPTGQRWGVRVTGTWVGTLAFELSTDNGQSWSSVSMQGSRAAECCTSTTGSSTSVNGVWLRGDDTTLYPDVPGGIFRVRASSWTSGTATVAVGMRGGEAAARMSAGGFTGNPTRIYTRILVFTDPNWTNGGNTGTKFFFFSQNQGNNHFTGALGGEGGSSGAFIGLQGTSFRNIPGNISVSAPNGTWTNVEFLFIANTPGVSDGIAKAWINGVQAINASDVMFFAAGKTPGFPSLWMDPTYGGGGAAPPRNVFFRIAGWYRESAP